MPQPTPDTMALHAQAAVFDAATLRYATLEPYASRIHEAGVDVCSLTMASEQDDWDETLRHIEEVHERLAKLPFFAHCMTAAAVTPPSRKARRPSSSPPRVRRRWAPRVARASHLAPAWGPLLPAWLPPAPAYSATAAANGGTRGSPSSGRN